MLLIPKVSILSEQTSMIQFLFFLTILIYLSIYIPWPFPPVWGVANNTEETTKQWGFHSVLLAMTGDPAEFGWHCWSNTAHPPPSSTTYIASYMPSPRLPLPQGCLYKATSWQQHLSTHIIMQLSFCADDDIFEQNTDSLQTSLIDNLEVSS